MTHLPLPRNPGSAMMPMCPCCGWGLFVWGTAVTLAQGTPLLRGVRRTPHKLQTASPQNQDFKNSFPWGILAAAFGARGRLTSAGTEALPRGSQPRSPQP